MPRALWIPDYLNDFGLQVVVLPGFETRGGSSLSAKGVVMHHIGLPRGRYNAPGLGLVTHGRVDLPFTLCNVHRARDGRATAVASGTATHAGTGGWLGLRFNPSVLGVESEGTTGEHLTSVEIDADEAICAALLAGLEREEGWACAHAEWAGPRKPDAWGLLNGPGGMAGFRARVAAHLNPPILEEDDDMAKPWHVMGSIPYKSGLIQLTYDGGVRFVDHNGAPADLGWPHPAERSFYWNLPPEARQWDEANLGPVGFTDIEPHPFVKDGYVIQRVDGSRFTFPAVV